MRCFLAKSVGGRVVVLFGGEGEGGEFSQLGDEHDSYWSWRKGVSLLCVCTGGGVGRGPSSVFGGWV